MLKIVTITGADDKTDPHAMAEISRHYPFVEWGILASRRQQGKPRYPSLNWMKSLFDLRLTEKNMRFSLHLCGAYVRELLNAQFGFVHEENELNSVFDIFDRVQINTHGEPHTYHPACFHLMNSFPSKEFIFQYDGANSNLVLDAAARCQNIAALFDLSSGTGLLPDKWPAALDKIKCGYAGGLSPRNLPVELPKIEKAATMDRDIWIDAETHVRSFRDGVEVLDMDKVKDFLETANVYVEV